ncbi:hypothetical protein JHK86_036884 [Glycine max]|nr:hypothetical protein JHK86_036884 [Glycine max]
MDTLVFLCSGGLFETDHKIVEKEVAKMKEEILNNASIREISEQCEAERIQFRIEVLQGNLPEVAVNAATRLEAKTVILDRQMKKYKKNFKQSLSCALLIMNRDNTLRHLRGPRETQLSDGSNGNANFASSYSKSPQRIQQVANAIFCSNSSSSIQTLTKVVCPQSHSQMKQFLDNREQDMARGYCILPTSDTRNTNHTDLYHIETPVEHSNNPESYQIVEQFKNSVCSIGETNYDYNDAEHSRKPLSWAERIKVAIGAAKGLLFLHQNNIIHRDVRPSNILVTHDYEAMLGDFGLARTEQMDSLYSTDVVGTIGYLAPEYAESGKMSTKTDVYSFGVVLLQLITGMRTADKRLGDKSLVGWARPLLKERNYPDLIDERMMENHDCHQLFWMIRLAEKCLSRDSQRRLSMDTVVTALTHILEGNTCSVVLRDCSPARSDSSYDMSDLLISDASQKLEGEDASIYAGYAPIWLRPPPSPPLGSTSSCTSSMFTGPSESSLEELSNDENKGKKPNDQGGIF